MTNHDYIAPWHRFPALQQTAKSAIIIGGGIAGASTAFSLVKRGFKVTLIERHEQLACEGSGNDQGILHAHISPHLDLQSCFILEGYKYSIQLLKTQLQQGDAWQQCGVFYPAFSEKERQRQSELAQSELAKTDLFSLLTPQKATEITGISLNQSGLFFPHGGWVSPKTWIQKLVSHQHISLMLSTQAISLHHDQNEWHVIDENARCIARADIVVLANALDANRLSQTAHLPLIAVRGQTTRLPSTSESEKLKTVLSGRSYLCPQKRHFHTFGASSIIGNDDNCLLDEEHQLNLTHLAELAPAIAQSFMAKSMRQGFSGHAAIRCASLDRFPLVGAIADKTAFQTTFAHLSRDGKFHFNEECPWLFGLYVNIAHGARGLLTAPLSAEILASQICSETPILSKALLDALNPNRFLVRDLIRGKDSVVAKSHRHFS